MVILHPDSIEKHGVVRKIQQVVVMTHQKRLQRGERPGMVQKKLKDQNSEAKLLNPACN